MRKGEGKRGNLREMERKEVEVMMYRWIRKKSKEQKNRGRTEGRKGWMMVFRENRSKKKWRRLEGGKKEGRRWYEGA